MSPLVTYDRGRDLLLLLCGLAGIAFETVRVAVACQSPHAELLLVFIAMIGLSPARLFDRKTADRLADRLQKKKGGE